MVLENFIFTVKIVLYKVTVKIATTKNLDLKFYNKKHKTRAYCNQTLNLETFDQSN